MNEVSPKTLPPEKWLQWITIFLGILVLVVTCLVLKALQAILIPFFIALFLVYLAEPLQKLLIHWKIPRGLRICLVLFITAFLLYLIGQLVYSSVKSINNHLPQYEQRIMGLADEVIQSLPIPSEEIQSFMNNFRWSEHFQPGTVAKIVGTSFGQFGGFLGNLFLVLLYMVYLLYERESFFKRVANSFRTKKAERITKIIQQINLQIASYLEIKTLLSLLTGSTVTVVLWIFGVDFALFWGILTFLLNFIPSIGSVIATVPPILIAFLQFEKLWIPFTILALLVFTQMVIGNVIEPKVMGGKLGLSPLVVILFLIFGGWLWGATGMILSVPIISAIRIVCDNIEMLRPISGFLAEKT